MLFLKCVLGLQFSSVAQSCPILCDPMDCSTPGLSIHHQLPEIAQTHIHWVSDAIQPSHLLPFPSPLPSIFPSVRVFSNESALQIRWPKYWSFSFNIHPSSEYTGLISLTSGSGKIRKDFFQSPFFLLWSFSPQSFSTFSWISKVLFCYLTPTLSISWWGLFV